MIYFIVVGRVPPPLTSHDLLRLARVLGDHRRRRRVEEIGLRCVSSSEMRRLNASYRKHDYATDVLSFPPAVLGHTAEPFLGDIVLCPSYASQEAKRRGIAVKEEFVRLITHGFLHLVGYDHATNDGESRMFLLQEQILARVLGSSYALAS